MAVDRDRVASLVRELLEAIGEDPDRPGLTATPRRVADAYAEFFAGVGEDAAAPLAHTISVSRGPAPDTLPSVRCWCATSASARSASTTSCRSSAPRISPTSPASASWGSGRSPRVVATLASRPQVQERLGEQIADVLAGSLDARGVLVVLDAEHSCVTMRGERQPDASTVTIAARGVFTDPAARAELIALIGGRRR